MIQAVPFAGLSWSWSRTQFDEFDTSEASHDWIGKVGAGFRFDVAVLIVGYEKSLRFEVAPVALSGEVRFQLGL